MARASAKSEPEELGPAFWKEQVKLVERDTETWRKRSRDIIKRYRDERAAGNTSMRRMNLLWSNVQTLMPSIYGRAPIPNVERRFLDRDPVGRTASMILERTLRYELEDSGQHHSTKQSVLDYLLPGRGQIWVRYDPVFGEDTSIEEVGDTEETAGFEGEGNPDSENATGDAAEPVAADEPPQEALLSESVCVDYVNWEDFATFPPKVRIWEEVEGVGKRSYLSKDELEGRFGKDVADKVPLDHTPEAMNEGRTITSAGPGRTASKATVWEIWHKPTRKVFFIAKSYDEFLEEPSDDPLRLEGFWPCPRPLMATTTNDTLTPVPDYIEYQDQALEIDELTRRIGSLIKALKVSGVYDASQKGIERLLNESHENQLIPVNSWAAFAQKGGLENAIAFLPIKEVGEVLLSLFEARTQIKNDLYEITGISDIIRGHSDPNETATAQKIKGSFATVRLQDKQTEVARFCRDTIRIVGEIIAEHFAPETLIEASGIMLDEGVGPQMPEPPGPPPQMPPAQPPMMPQPGVDPQQAAQAQQQAMQQQQQAQQAMMAYQAAVQKYQMDVQAAQMAKQQLVNDALQLLRTDKLRGFRIDIETDTTIAENAVEGKHEATEFIGAVTKFMSEGAVMAAQTPSIVPLLGKMLQFGVRHFRVGRDLESAIDEFVAKAEKDAKAMEANAKANPQQNPQALKNQSDVLKAQAEIAKARIDAESHTQTAMINAQSRQMEAAQREREHQMQMDQHQRDAEFAALEHSLRMKEMQGKLHADVIGAVVKNAAQSHGLPQ